MKNYKEMQENIGGFKKQIKSQKRYDDGVSKKSNFNPKKHKKNNSM